MLSDTLLFSDDAMLAHQPGPGHPERPDRLRAIMQELDRRPVAGVTCAKPQPAAREQIERIHDPQYVDRLASLRGRIAQLDPDTAISPGSVEAAYLAAGAAIGAVGSIVRGNSHTRAWALVRPPGHHAEADRAMGFCLFNNIAIAAEHAIAELGCQRLLIVDWDVHHGNGTQHIFEARRDVLVFNTHQWPFYPGTGALHEVGRGDGTGFTVNCPLPAGMGDAAYVDVYRRLLVPIAQQYRPDLVLVSAGFDAHRDDPLGGMMMTEDGFAALCAIVQSIADQHAGGRLALVLEGGYNLTALARSVRACLEVLAGAEAPSMGNSEPAAQGVIDQMLGFHRQYWKI